jgi:hypothetical protein
MENQNGMKSVVGDGAFRPDPPSGGLDGSKRLLDSTSRIFIAKLENPVSNDSIERPTLPYKYIESDELSKNFGFCMNSQNKEFTIYFVMYEIKYLFVEGVIDPPPKINFCQEKTEPGIPLTSRLTEPNMFYPYLKFVVEKKEEIYSFPSNNHVCMQNSSQEMQKNTDNGDDKSPDQIYFETECMKHVLGFFSDTSILHNENLDIYKGFVEHDNNSIFAFFDVSSLSKFLKPPCITAVVDEVFYKQKIYSVPIDPFISSFFDKNIRFIDLMSHDDEYKILKFPFQLYLCKLENEQYENVKKGEPIQPFEHPFFGYSYYFSSNPLDSDTTNIDELIRFNCFTFRNLYIMNNSITELSEQEKEYYKKGIETNNAEINPYLPTIENIQEASTISFVENGAQLWSIKNILHFTE